MTEKQVKLSRLFKDGAFKGYALSVDGMLLSNQKQTVVETNAGDIHPALSVGFIVTDELTHNAPDIHI
ncbi:MULTISPECIES: hypothetical protein [Photorhabdus]|uniref:hypothetical protein n=1 Tax=Photorhabdus TaxID=29487 RepID=UPI0007B4D866|nr:MULTISPECIES: hypothetical protein [Photorhabdus]AXG42239.1 hypothetical protein PluDJC_08225 [Photorhabdus laumondii subsp. laumondii]MCC8389263.1 hypothetical protein [Photorhabdus laumondii]MCZ1250579.1 hypothetical protein [Photorhabdus laumondii subsp. laumondii]NDL16080.1 hypothetical protein [Photorhabdus laumondii subsp. laumondii]NDL47264.1 hypothetical protein [Photorhabdus laumondii subsp. laumondii]